MLIFSFVGFALTEHEFNVFNNFFNFVFASFSKFVENLALVFLRVNFFNFILFNECFAGESKVGFFQPNFAYEKTWGTNSILVNNKHNFLIYFNVFLVPAITNIVRQNADFKQASCKILSFFHVFSIYFTNIFGKQIFNKINVAMFFLPNFGVWFIFIT